MDGLAVGCNHRQLMAFNCNLSRAHGRESVDHAESVASAGCHCEDFQRSVGHEAGVRVAELTFAVDEHGFRILAGVDSQTPRISLGGVFVQPIRQQHDVSRQIEVIEMRIWVTRWRLSHDDRTMQAIEFLQTCVSVPEVSSSVASPLISVRKKFRLYYFSNARHNMGIARRGCVRQEVIEFKVH